MSVFIVQFYLLHVSENDDMDTNRLATAPRPGTTLRPETNAKNPQQMLVSSRPRTMSGRPVTGMVSNRQINGKVCFEIVLLVICSGFCLLISLGPAQCRRDREHQ